MRAKNQLTRAVWAAVVPFALSCGSGDSAHPPSRPEEDSGVPPPAPVCTGPYCCPDIEWMLISPVKTGLGGLVDLDASVRRIPGQPHKIKWAVEGGGVEADAAPQATYTCEHVGVFKVSFSASNRFCETSQESHIQCAK